MDASPLVHTLTNETTAFWDVAPCILVAVDRRFRGVYCLHHHGAISQKAIIFILAAART
jgi:hypothetical protein